MRKLSLFLLVLVQVLLLMSCSQRDQYLLNIVYTSDTKGFLEDCG